MWKQIWVLRFVWVAFTVLYGFFAPPLPAAFHTPKCLEMETIRPQSPASTETGRRPPFPFISWRAMCCVLWFPLSCTPPMGTFPRLNPCSAHPNNACRSLDPCSVNRRFPSVQPLPVLTFLSPELPRHKNYFAFKKICSKAQLLRWDIVSTHVQTMNVNCTWGAVLSVFLNSLCCCLLIINLNKLKMMAAHICHSHVDGGGKNNAWKRKCILIPPPLPPPMVAPPPCQPLHNLSPS